MATCYCACGAKYQVPDSAVGKEARCQRCGTTFIVEAEDESPIPVADGIGVADEVEVAAERARAAALSARQGEIALPPGSPGTIAGPGARPIGPAGPTDADRGYAGNVLWTFLFLASPGNLVIFVAIWMLMVFVFEVLLRFSFFFVFTVIAWALIMGWYCVFRFNVVQVAAAGESDLPEVNFPRDLYGDLLRPLAAWVGTWVVVLWPALAYLVYAWQRGQLTFAEAVEIVAAGVEGLWQGATSGELVFDILVYLGLALWPMVVLCVALGGFATVFRMDLLALTIIKTLPIYLLTLVLMFGAIVLVQTLEKMSSGVLASSVLVTGLAIYVDIVLMRLIGLYYRHFKRRFAWDWG